MNIMIADRAVMEISSIDEILEEAREGRCFILVNDLKANEGSVVIPAEFAGADVLSFISRHAHGLIYLALTRQCAAKLNLSELKHSRSTSRSSSFALSIEARFGTSKGMSAFDRARTIEIAINPKSNSSDITTPGNIFPFISRDNGIFDRAGHTEAAVDIARLAGLNPSAVICEIINDEGRVASLRELMMFARTHGMKIGTIGDLVTFRLRKEIPRESVSVSTARPSNFRTNTATAKRL